MNTNKRSGFLQLVIKYKVFLIMLSPALIYYILFSYIPMFGVVLAFENYNLRTGFFSHLIGFKNFKFLFITGDLLGVAKNTVLYNATFIVVNTTLALSSAIMICELTSKAFKKIAQSFMFLPYFISWVVVGAFAYSMLNYDTGLINYILKSLHMEPFDFYNTPSVWPIIIVLLSAWKSIGYGSVIYIAAITGIDAEMYEAAEIDGANIFKRIRHITIPCLVPTIIVLVLMSIGSIFRGDFAMFFQLVGNNGVLLPKTDVVDTFVTRYLLNSNDIGMASSAGLFQSVVCFVTIMVVNKIVKTYEKDYALF